MRFAAPVLFIAVFVPISLGRRMLASSRFGSRFHRGSTAWDKPYVSNPR